MTGSVSIGPVQLSPDELPALAHTLGDSPETAIPANRLMRGACSAYVVGQPARFKAAVVVSVDNPQEPFGFGEDPDALWSILAPLVTPTRTSGYLPWMTAPCSTVSPTT